MNMSPELANNQGGSPGLVIMGGDSCWMVVGSNPSTVCCMDIFTYICCKILMFV